VEDAVDRGLTYLDAFEAASARLPTEASTFVLALVVLEEMEARSLVPLGTVDKVKVEIADREIQTAQP
jgi:hypothetical protein